MVTVLYVDRSVKYSYPDGTTILHPELESLGPSEYSITTIDQWLHEGQMNGGCVSGQVVYDYLKDTNALGTCLGLHDLMEISNRGRTVFRRHFRGKAVIGMKSVVQDNAGRRYAPVISEAGDLVVLDWCLLEDDWSDFARILRFASPRA